jgi:hypothetical protein
MSVQSFIGEKDIRDQKRSQMVMKVADESQKQWKAKFEKLYLMANFVSQSAILVCQFLNYFLIKKCKKNSEKKKQQNLTNDLKVDESVINKENIVFLLGFFLGIKNKKIIKK